MQNMYTFNLHGIRCADTQVETRALDDCILH